MMVMYLPIKFDFDWTNRFTSRFKTYLIQDFQEPIIAQVINLGKGTFDESLLENTYVGKSKKFIGTQVCV